MTVLLLSCRGTNYTYTTDSRYYEPGKENASRTDSTLIQSILPYADQMSDSMNFIIGYAEKPMEKGKPESELGNFVADICYSMAAGRYNNPIDFCVLNNGGLRSSLPAGELRVKNIFELMPFENELVVLTLSGDSAMQVLSYIASRGGVPVSNIKMKIHNNAFSDAVINGKPFDKNANYRVLTSDYLAEGGDAMTMFAGPVKNEPVNLRVRDAIIAYIMNEHALGKTVSAIKDGRISN